MAQIEMDAGLSLLRPHLLRRDPDDTSASNDNRSQVSVFSLPRPVQQDFTNESAPVPLQQSTSGYVSGQKNTNSTYLINAISWDNSPLLKGSGLKSKRAALLNRAGLSRKAKSPLANRQRTNHFPYLEKRGEVATQCGPGQPCADGSCCSKGYVKGIQGVQLWLKNLHLEIHADMGYVRCD